MLESNLGRAIAYFIYVLVMGLSLAIAVNCQSFTKVKKEKKILHTDLHTVDDQGEWEDAHRVITFRFTKKENGLIYWMKPLKREIKLSSFAYDKKSFLPKHLESGKCYLAIYCKEHLWINSMSPVKCKTYGL